jgi:hypothetical protein
MGLFTQGVYYYHDGVVAVRLREFDYEIDTYGVPSGVGCRQWIQVTSWRLSLDLSPETEIASSSVLADVS